MDKFKCSNLTLYCLRTLPYVSRIVLTLKFYRARCAHHGAWDAPYETQLVYRLIKLFFLPLMTYCKYQCSIFHHIVAV